MKRYNHSRASEQRGGTRAKENAALRSSQELSLKDPNLCQTRSELVIRIRFIRVCIRMEILPAWLPQGAKAEEGFWHLGARAPTET